jgi:hypothetical protein
MQHLLHIPTRIGAEDGLFPRPSGTMPPPCTKPKGEEGVEADGELMLEDASSIRKRLWRMARYAQDAADEEDFIVSNDHPQSFYAASQDLMLSITEIWQQ